MTAGRCPLRGTHWTIGALVLLIALAAAPLSAALSAEIVPPIRLSLWTWSMRPWFDEYCADLIASFEREHPGVKIEWTDVPDEALVRKYFAAGAAGQLPDVVTVPDKMFLRFAHLGGLSALEALLPGKPDDVYVAPALDVCRIDGKLLGLPWYLSTEIGLVNPKLLADGGLSPATLGRHWSELLAQAGPFHRKTGQHLFMVRLGEIDLVNMITAEGLQPIKPLPGGGYRSNLLDPAVVRLMETWVNAVRADDVPRESATAGYAETVAAFKEQRIALLNADAVRSVRSDSPSLYESLVLRPGITGRIDRTGIASVEVAVSSQSVQPRLAAELAWFITSPPWQERLCRQASRVPSTKSSLLIADFSLGTNPQDKLKEALGIGCQQLENDRAQSFFPPTGEWPDMEIVFGDELKHSMLEDVPVRTALERVDRQWNEVLTTSR